MAGVQDFQGSDTVTVTFTDSGEAKLQLEDLKQSWYERIDFRSIVLYFALPAAAIVVLVIVIVIRVWRRQ